MALKGLFRTKKGNRGMWLLLISVSAYLIYRNRNTIKNWFTRSNEGSNQGFDDRVSKQDYYNHVLTWEGGQSDNDTHSDFAPGTDVNVNKGVTWDTYTGYKDSVNEIPDVQEFLEMPYSLWEKIADQRYWNVWDLDSIFSPKIRYIVHSYAWGSGNLGSEIMLANWIRSKYTQEQLEQRGIQNYNDIKKYEIVSILNEWEENLLFDLLVEERRRLYSTFSTYHLYGNGWNNRMDALVSLYD